MSGKYKPKQAKERLKNARQVHFKKKEDGSVIDGKQPSPEAKIREVKEKETKKSGDDKTDGAESSEDGTKGKKSKIMTQQEIEDAFRYSLDEKVDPLVYAAQRTALLKTMQVKKVELTHHQRETMTSYLTQKIGLPLMMDLGRELKSYESAPFVVATKELGLAIPYGRRLDGEYQAVLSAIRLLQNSIDVSAPDQEFKLLTNGDKTNEMRLGVCFAVSRGMAHVRPRGVKSATDLAQIRTIIRRLQRYEFHISATLSERDTRMAKDINIDESYFYNFAESSLRERLSRDVQLLSSEKLDQSRSKAKSLVEPEMEGRVLFALSILDGCCYDIRRAIQIINGNEGSADELIHYNPNVLTRYFLAVQAKLPDLQDLEKVLRRFEVNDTFLKAILREYGLHRTPIQQKRLVELLSNLNTGGY